MLKFFNYKTLKIKALIRSKKLLSGQNNTGHIVTYHKAGGHKRNYRLIDFARKLYNIPAIFLTYLIDPNRNALIALICYANGFLSYILACKNLTSLNYIDSGLTIPIHLAGHSLLANMLIGLQIYNLEFQANLGGKAIRSGGCWGQILRKKNNFAFIKMPSGEIRKISNLCFASIGTVQEYSLSLLKKAGDSRYLGSKSIVRGVAMNPVDHPLGGGEGKSSGGRPSVSPWGILTKGYWKTRAKRNIPSHIIFSKHTIFE